MPLLTIYFGGVCVFFPQYQRMVVPNAGVSSIFGQPVAPHVALLTAPPSFGPIPGLLSLGPVSGPLQPIQLQESTTSYVLNSGPGVFRIVIPELTGTPYSPPDCLISLTGQLRVPMQLDASPWVVTEGGAACYVDFLSGEIVGRALDQAGGLMAIAEATVDTDNIIIEAGGVSQTTIPIPTDMEIAITNFAASMMDRDEDFLLNYLVCTNILDAGDIDTSPNVTCTREPRTPAVFPPFEAGPGCSTTQFP